MGRLIRQKRGNHEGENAIQLVYNIWIDSPMEKLRQPSVGSVYLTSNQKGCGDDPVVKIDNEQNNLARIFYSDAVTSQRSLTMSTHDAKIPIIRVSEASRKFCGICKFSSSSSSPASYHRGKNFYN